MTLRKRTWLATRTGIVILALFALCSIAYFRQPLPVATAMIEGAVLRLEVASTPHSQSRGLQGREHLSLGEGMLFAWADSDYRTFETKDMQFPVDVIYLNDHGRVIQVGALVPGAVDRSQSVEPVSYVIETPAGWAVGAGVEVSSRLEFIEVSLPRMKRGKPIPPDRPVTPTPFSQIDRLLPHSQKW